MKRLLVPLIALVLLVAPAVIPTVQVSADQNNAMTTLVDNGTTFHLATYDVTVTRGGDAQAWNLIYELCRAGVPGMCDLYSEGLGILW